MDPSRGHIEGSTFGDHTPQDIFSSVDRKHFDRLSSTGSEIFFIQIFETIQLGGHCMSRRSKAIHQNELCEVSNQTISVRENNESVDGLGLRHSTLLFTSLICKFKDMVIGWQNMQIQGRVDRLAEYAKLGTW